MLFNAFLWLASLQQCYITPCQQIKSDAFLVKDGQEASETLMKKNMLFSSIASTGG